MVGHVLQAWNALPIMNTRFQGLRINQLSAEETVSTIQRVPGVIYCQDLHQWGVHDWSLILLPANSVNTAQVQASSWPQLDSCWYPALFPPHGMGEGILPMHTNITSLLVVDGAGCELVEMDDHKLIARGWPVAKLLEYQWEYPLLTKWWGSGSLSKDVSQTSTQ